MQSEWRGSWQEIEQGELDSIEAHNLDPAGSIPAPATLFLNQPKRYLPAGRIAFPSFRIREQRFDSVNSVLGVRVQCPSKMVLGHHVGRSRQRLFGDLPRDHLGWGLSFRLGVGAHAGRCIVALVIVNYVDCTA